MYKNEIIFVSGMRGSGKSYWVKNYLLSLPRLVVYDSLGEYKGQKRVFQLIDLINFFKKKKEGFYDVIFDTYNNENFPLFCKVIMTQKNLYVIVEEIDFFSTPFFTCIELQKLIKYGRHYQINIIGISRRPAEVSRLFTSQATRFIIFSQKEPRDIAYFKSIIGDKANLILNLQNYQYLDVNFTDNTPVQICNPV